MTLLKTTWARRLRFAGIVIDDPDYHIWGCSPIWGNDARVHVFAARIPIATGFYKWWATSQIAHYVADQPAGPFALVDVLLRPGQTPAGSWDCGTQHNPTITKIDDRYVLSYHASMGSLHDRKRATARIGMMTATDLNGPWTRLGLILQTPTRRQVPIVPEHYDGGTDNPALIRHPDGRFFLYYRIKFPGLQGENTYGLAIADRLEGPYVHHPDRVVNNPTYIEDPYVFVHDERIYMLITDKATRGGLLLSSQDGLHFDYSQGAHAFGPIQDYVPPAQLPPPVPDMPQDCFERPQLLITDGTPTHLFAPCGTNLHGGQGTCCYLFEIERR